MWRTRGENPTGARPGFPDRAPVGRTSTARRCHTPHAVTAECALLDGDARADGLEGLGGLVRGLLVDLLEQRLRRAVDEVLGLLQTQRGQLAHDLDDLDLLVAGGLEDDVELVLLLDLGRGLAAALGRTGGDRD